MARYFNGKEIELLAPVGTFEIFESVIRTNCDAVYMGGPSLNMRMLRKGYNFSYEEIEQAIAIAHSLNKKVYITVNNLLNETELEDAEAYLQFLARVQPDALIVQDFAILELIYKHKLNIPIHSSVMMNVHNIAMVQAVKALGVTRVVASREMDLKTVELLHQKTDMEIEYFMHGDMCTVHGANCLISSTIFGLSSNRGKCMKPCRWDYRVKKDGYIYPTEYPLAAKDMFMYEHIPELIKHGVSSFKIEGRMRDKEFVTMLVNSYGDAIDRYIDDPIGFNRSQDTKLLYDNRKRDFSTAYAFGKPGLDNINRRYEGTGKFYSTGKVFSTPTAEKNITDERIELISNSIMEAVKKSKNPEASSGNNKHSQSTRTELSVRVNNIEQARMAIAEGVDHLYLSGDVFLPDLPFTKQDLIELTANKGNTKIYLGMPRMMTELHFEQYEHLLKQQRFDLDGLLITNLGALYKFRSFGYPMIGDLSLNLYNHKAVELYEQMGLERFTTSIELPLQEFTNFMVQSTIPKEVIVHGSPIIMYLEHDLYENVEVFQPIGEEDNQFVDNDILVLMTDKGESPVYQDHHGRNHLALAKELCYLPFLRELQAIGAAIVRIEGASYKTEQLRTIIQAYKKALHSPEQCVDQFKQLPPVGAGYTLGTLHFN
ncbi:U32 family peptidase [Paenibacillus albiflavus]|uniref:U32 family peptidase n=1 Tax=Paenibacillus albiflavus TaxID=2545760 RepID=A0A4R4EEB1_9BACL|nr:U32 family peptidase [Paenibacillus albiflavus]TCZ76355.1 U32 family peptidase [Paenibacillus albiflavus]